MNKLTRRSIFCIVLFCFIFGNAYASEKNNGVFPAQIESGTEQVRAGDPPGHPFPVDSLVRATVDGPSGNSCIKAGDVGTIYCYDSADPILPYLVNWENGCGFPGSAICARLAPDGWWVGFTEIELIEGVSDVDITVGSGYMNFAVTNGAAPDSAHCESSGDYGRAIFDQVTKLLYICSPSGWISK